MNTVTHADADALMLLMLVLTVCPPITPPIPVWLKNWELKYILLAA